MRLPERERRFLETRVSALTLAAGYRADVANSPPYQERMAKWRLQHPRASCYVCGTRRFVLHHRTYERFGGDERDDDLVALCRTHHDDVHSFVEHHADDDDALWNAHERMREAYRQEQQAGARIRQQRLLKQLVCAKLRLSRDPGNERLATLVERLETKWQTDHKVPMERGR
jgi:hypothetical protein